MFFRLCTAVFLLSGVASHPSYQAQIPNGAAVPFPCKTGQIWAGVGHFISAGTGARNLFGQDFAAAGFKWTVALCQKDSDGDGWSNGAELGDPDCTWVANSGPPKTNATSHPGICDPWDSQNCSQKLLTGGKYTTQQAWMQDVCKSDVFQCAALNETGITTLTIRLPPATPIPAKTTTYECQIFDLFQMGVPSDQDFHIVAVTPVINNSRVLHHMVLMGCENDTSTTTAPYECGMSASPKCQEFMHVWTVGLSGECYHPQSGIRIGRTGFRIIAIQLHWNNPPQQGGMTDSSGVQIYYTPKLRPYDAGVLMIGSSLFALPPHQPEVIVRGYCYSSCTKTQFIGPVNVTSAWNHMHYAGRKMYIEVERDNKPLSNLTDDQAYSYDSPIVHSYPNPYVLLPGDELRTVCSYSTMDRNKTTLFGEATEDEMCFGFVTYYPKQNITVPDCVDYMGISFCNPPSLQGCTNIMKYLQQNSSLFVDVTQNCKRYYPCVSECVDTLVKYMKTDPCLQGNVWEYLQYIFTLISNGDFLSRVLSCKAEVKAAMGTSQPYVSTTTEPDGAMVATEASVLVLAASILLTRLWV